MRSIYPFIIIVITVAFSSCTNPDDQLPQVIRLSVNENNDNHFMALAGDELKIDLDLKDNKSLKQLMVQVKTKSGFHHLEAESETTFFKQLGFGALDTIILYKLNGQPEQSISIQFPLHDSLLGKCDMTIGLLDDNGNYFTKTYDLHIHNMRVPSLMMNSIYPTPEESVIHIHAAEISSLLLNGQIIDSTGLSNIKAYLASNNQIFWEQSWELTPDIWQFELHTIQINQEVAAGRYNLTIEAKDIENWISVFRGDVQVH